ncbi:MAG: M48 family metallopeptidase [Armatimonadota bacterium]|jgi:predicted Zn-dependent protease
MNRFVIVVLLAISVAALSCSLLQAASKQDEEEMRLGRDSAEEIERQVTLIDDPEVTERVNRIGQELAKIAKEKEVNADYGSSTIANFNYTFKVIDNKDVNAFALPGGYIYVNSGLLNIIDSDDELAGVLAHEIAHASHHHTMQLVRKQTAVNRIVAIITLAGILANAKSQDLQNLMYGAQLLRTGKMSGYTMQAEKDADRTAVAYLIKSKYNPEGMLSLMKKLDDLNDANPTLSLGIYQDHPAPFRRIAAITKAMKEHGLEVSPQNSQSCYAKTVPSHMDNTLYEVVVGKKLIYCPAEIDNDEMSSKSRCDKLAEAINYMMAQRLTDKDICVDTQCYKLILRDSEVLQVEPADAALLGESRAALLQRTKEAIQYIIWADWLNNRCAVVQASLNEESD